MTLIKRIHFRTIAAKSSCSQHLTTWSGYLQYQSLAILDVTLKPSCWCFWTGQMTHLRKSSNVLSTLLLRPQLYSIWLFIIHFKAHIIPLLWALWPPGPKRYTSEITSNSSWPQMKNLSLGLSLPCVNQVKSIFLFELSWRFWPTFMTVTVNTAILVQELWF